MFAAFWSLMAALLWVGSLVWWEESQAICILAVLWDVYGLYCILHSWINDLTAVCTYGCSSVNCSPSNFLLHLLPTCRGQEPSRGLSSSSSVPLLCSITELLCYVHWWACMHVCVCAQYSSLEPVHTYTFICTFIRTYSIYLYSMYVHTYVCMYVIVLSLRYCHCYHHWQ